MLMQLHLIGTNKSSCENRENGDMKNQFWSCQAAVVLMT